MTDDDAGAPPRRRTRGEAETRRPQGQRQERPVQRGQRQAARQAGLRSHNIALVLDHVACAEPDGVSRAAVAEAAGLTRATVSALVERLLSLGLVEWAPTSGPTGVGRPASPIRLARGRWAGLGLEVGANHLAVAVGDLMGETLAQAEVRGDFAARSPGDTLEALGRLGVRTWEQARAAHPEARRAGRRPRRARHRAGRHRARRAAAGLDRRRGLGGAAPRSRGPSTER